jgi:hypothetical protein
MNMHQLPGKAKPWCTQKQCVLCCLGQVSFASLHLFPDRLIIGSGWLGLDLTSRTCSNLSTTPPTPAAYIYTYNRAAVQALVSGREGAQ